MRVSDMNIDRIYVSSMVRAASYKMVENHYHYYYELYYVKQGSTRFFIDNALYDLHAGDFLIIPPHTIHYNRYLSTCTRINIYFKETDLTKNNALFLPDLDTKFLRLCQVHVPSAYRDLFSAKIDEMLQEDKVDDENTKEMLELMLKQFFISAKRHCSFQYTNSPHVAGEEDEGIIKAAKYITAHYNQPLTLDQLAQIADLSPSYFSRKFKITTGMRMTEFISYIRLEHAAQELISTSHTITDIAINSGFSDSNYFKDSFRKAYGMSPRAYRASRKTDLILEHSIQTQPQK